MTLPRAFITLLVAGLLASCGPAPAQPSVTRAWIPAPPDGAPTMAGFADIHNDTGHAVTIVSASSPAFERVELHRTVVRKGQATMKPVDALTLPNGGRARLSPGTMHLMLIHPKHPIEPGQHVRITLELLGGGSLDADFVVGARQPDGR